MRKLVYLVLSVVLVIGLTACGGKGGSDGAAEGGFTWTRAGTFSDENGNYLLISASEDEEHKDMWAVTIMVGDEYHGWFIAQEGEALHGNLDTEYDDYEGDYIVTVTEEGDSGVMVEVEGGETYHFALADIPETIATLKINTEGMGTLAYGVEGEEVEFDDEFPNQSTVVNLSEPQTYVIKAKADEGWKFVKWTKDGKDFSEEPEITVEVSEDVEYIAVFETE